MNYTNFNDDEIIAEIISIGGLDKFFTKIGIDLGDSSRYSEQWLQENLPLILEKTNIISATLASESGHPINWLNLRIRNGARLAYLLNGFGIVHFQKVIKIIQESVNPLKSDYLNDYYDTLKELSANLVQPFKQAMGHQFVLSMTTPEGSISPRRLARFIEQDNPNSFAENLQLMQKIGLSISIDCFVKILKQLDAENDGLDIYKLEQSVAAVEQDDARRIGRVPYRPLVEKNKRNLLALQKRKSKREDFIQLVSPVLMLPQTSITFNDVKVIIASLVENLELNQQVILKKIIFDSLVKHPSFNMSFVKSAQELRDLMACFSIAERAIILNKFQTLLPKFSESTDLFHSMVRDLSENSLIFADYYDEVMPHFTGNARTAAFSVIYTSILHECRMNDYYVIKSDDIPTKETLHHLPSHVKEAYVRCIYIKDTSESEILRMTNTLYYVDRSLALCHQIHLTPKELDEFDQIEFGNSKKLSTKTLEKFSLLLREKTDFYCNASGFADYETNQDFSVDMVLQKTTQFINSNSTEKPCMPALRQLCNHLSMFRDNPSHNILNGMKEILVEAYMQTLIEHKCSSSHSPEYKSNIYTLQFIQSLINHINKCGALINDAPLTKTQLKIKEFNERRNAKKNKSSETNKKTVKPVTEPLDMGGRTNQQAQACPQSHKKLSEAQIRILKNLKSGRAEPIQPAKDQTPDYSFYKLMDAFSDRRSFVNPFIRGCFFASVSLLIGGISSLLSPEHKVKTGLVVGAGIFGSLSLFMGIKTQNIDDKDVAKDAAKNNIR